MEYTWTHEGNISFSLSPVSFICLTSSSPLVLTLRYDHTFELYSESERLYLFGTDDPDGHKEWVKSIAKVSTGYILGSGNTDTNPFTFLEILEILIVL